MSFQEKSVLTTLIITIVLYGAYFTRAFAVFSNPAEPDTAMVGMFVTVIVAFVILQIVFQAVLAIAHRKELKAGEDERENLIALKATRISYFVLAAGIWISCMSMFVFSSPFILANVILFCFVVAEVVGFTVQLFYFRRGISYA